MQLYIQLDKKNEISSNVSHLEPIFQTYTNMAVWFVNQMTKSLTMAHWFNQVIITCICAQLITSINK